MQQNALLAGATGLIGFELLRFLIEADYHQVIAPVRKKLPYQRDKLLAPALQKSYAEALSEIADPFQDVFCCLGTTIKNAGSREQFRRIDLELPLELARTALAKGARRFFVVTAMGADTHSSVFYNKTKGELEEELSRLPFEELHIFRPSLLLGKRQEFRLGETLAGGLFSELSFLFAGPLRKYKPIEARTVARAMLRAARTEPAKEQPGPGHPLKQIYLSDAIARMGQEA